MIAEQIALEGFAPSEPTDRLFFALYPDAATAQHIAALAAERCAQRGIQGRPLRTDRLHVTLFHLGDWAGLPQQIVETASAAAAQVQAAPFDVRLDEIASFASHRSEKPLVLKASGGNTSLHDFRSQLARQLAARGLEGTIGQSFEPHITLAYDRRALSPERVLPVVWRAGEFMLVHSLLGQSRHIRLAHWTL